MEESSTPVPQSGHPLFTTVPHRSASGGQGCPPWTRGSGPLAPELHVNPGRTVRIALDSAPPWSNRSAMFDGSAGSGMTVPRSRYGEGSRMSDIWTAALPLLDAPGSSSRPSSGSPPPPHTPGTCPSRSSTPPAASCLSTEPYIASTWSDFRL